MKNKLFLLCSVALPSLAFGQITIDGPPFSAAWAYEKTQVQTWAANQTWEGTSNTMANQTDAGDSSVMTRSLVDARLLLYSAVKTATTTRTTTTLTDETDLSLTLPAGSYEVRVFLPFDVSAAANGGVSVKLISADTSATGYILHRVIKTNSVISLATRKEASGAWVNSVAGGPAAGGYFCSSTMEGTITTTTSANIKIQTAQQNADGTTSFYLGGWMTFRKLN
jgi:hypothetical protein